MVKTASTMLPLGSPAPDFSLINVVSGRTIALSDYAQSPGLLVMFICNHCPFVKHLADDLTRLATDYKSTGLAIVAISSNDTRLYPQDDAASMKEEAQTRGYPFPYLFDESQEVAKAYCAACTPDFFLFDSKMKLVYRGQFDSSRPGAGIPVTGEDVRRAIDQLLSGQAVFEPQQPSIGCNIKWKPGNEPDYFLNPAQR